VAQRKVISIVTPCYNESSAVRNCHQTIKEIFEKNLPNYDREHIFCDNASTDDTHEHLRAIAQSDPQVKVIFNARNFGILKNTFHGVRSSTGDATILFMPVDLQDPPELIIEFVQLWEQGYQRVFGIRKGREEDLFMKLLRKAYYRVLSKFSSIDYPADVGDFQLADRRVVDLLRTFDDAQPFMRVMTFECGFKSVGVPYTWRRRVAGYSKNRWSHLIDQGFNGIISYSTIPLRMAFFSGLAIAGISLIYALYVLVAKLLNPEIADQGIPTIIIAIFFFGGLNVFFIGLMGEYISAIYTQVRKRPLVIEKERINFK
jgi:polyisoprenyl-phosphate glycosyltransferase